jgi:hypothetical protein
MEGSMSADATYHFDPVDIEAIRLTAGLSAGARVQRLLDTRDILVSLVRTRLRPQYPNLSERDLNLEVLKEIERVERTHTRPHPLS